ncbi:MAG TPA: ATP-binding protein [Opitutaceae bacterium]|nr:ATP-binding protein [Opitutaceae bacterium]
MSLGLAAVDRAAEPADAAGAEEVITSVRQFWQIPPERAQQARRVRFEMVVAYYDPMWNLLWAESDDGISYVLCGPQSLPIRSGQRILIDGRMSLAAGLSLAQATVQVLAENQPLGPVGWSFRGTAAEAARLPSQWVEVEGFVNRQAEIDAAHVLLDMTIRGWPVQARVLLQGSAGRLQCESAFVRARGVLVPNLTPAGKLSALALWIPSPDGVTVTGDLRTDPRFDRAATRIEALPAAPPNQLMRVVGTVQEQEPGYSVTVRDETGQVAVLTGQLQRLQPGDQVEAIGYPATEGAKLALREGFFRRFRAEPAAAPAPAQGPPLLRLAEQVLEMGNDAARGAQPVRLFGIVTWAHAGVPFFFVNDASGGIRVAVDAYRGAIPYQSNTVTVEGISAAGDFAPEIQARRITVEGSLGFPEARIVTLEQAMTGVEEGQWIELDGYLREIARDGTWARLVMATAAGDFSAYLPPSDQLAAMRGSVLRVRGVCSAEANSRRQLVGIRLWVPSLDYVNVRQPAPADPFAVSGRSIASLRQFSALPAFNRQVLIWGVVVYQAAGFYVWIQDGAESLFVLSRQTMPLAPGDRIEAVGFPGREGSRLVLREAQYRRISGGREPEPVPVQNIEHIDETLDGRLVRIVATLLDTTIREKDLRLTLVAGNTILEALLDRSDERMMAGMLAPGSALALVGVYQIDFDEYRHPRALKLLLRSTRDIGVVRSPPWWTARRALVTAGALALCTVGGIAWVVTLRRRVRRQTRQIREQVAREARLEAELQRSAKLESLGLLAGGIAHDFNNLLTVIMGNLTLAKLDAPDQAPVTPWLAEAEQGVIRARDLTLQLLTFAKGGNPVRKAVELAEIVREATAFALHGSNVRCAFDIAPDLWPANVDKGQIGQVVHNIVINALQAMPDGGSLRIMVCNSAVEPEGMPGLAAGRYLKLSIADTGTGIDPAHLTRIFDPYFTTKAEGTGLGLATVYSIVKKHAGRVEVESAPGRGTTFHVWLPAAEEVPAGKEASASPLAPRSGRVLLMDDEESIRRAAAALLRRLGLETTAISNGADAVREYQAARRDGRPYDLVILDLTVPGGMGGRETMERLRQLDPEVRAVVSSGYSSDPVLAHYRFYGFRSMVGKPYDLEELAKAVGAALDGGRPA